MQLIPTPIHAVIDYLTGLLLVAAPWVYGFANGGAAQWIPVVLGLSAVGYSVLTDYELGLARLISMPVHLALDIAGGILLAASPWLFGFADVIVWPHLLIGLMEVLVASCTYRHPSTTPA